MTNIRIVKGIKSSTSIPVRRESSKELQLNTSNKQVKGGVLYIQKTHASSHESNYIETAPPYHNEEDQMIETIFDGDSDNETTGLEVVIRKNSSEISLTSSQNEHNRLMDIAREEAYLEARAIVPLLAMRAYHLPGNNWCQDWIQFMRNNHPFFGICCHHPLHPLRLGQRIICLIGSIAFGLAATNSVYLYYTYHNKDMNEVLFRIYLESNSTLSDDDISSVRSWEVTHGMVALWTFGGLMHSVFDLTIWYVSACSCFLTGGMLQQFPRMRKSGSYFVLVLVPILVSLSTYILVLRTRLENHKKMREEDADAEIDWNQVNGVESLQILLGYSVELGLALFVYYPMLGTILFSGILGCGNLPFLGGRPREVHQELDKKASTLSKRMKNSNINYDSDNDSSDDEISFNEEEFNNEYNRGRITV